MDAAASEAVGGHLVGRFVTTSHPIRTEPEGTDVASGSESRTRRWLPDLLGIAWVVVAAIVVMVPALAHGWSLGPFDQLDRLGLSQHFGSGPAPAPHSPQTSDLIREIIPWTTLAWTQVHHGFLPLWNPYSALGAPLAFNWQSAAFSLPSLIGYLVPVRLDFTVQVILTLLIGGTGMYVLARVMRLGVIGAAMAATAFELSGSFMAVLGWPIASVMSWSGWLFVCTILVIRGRHRRRNVALFALVLALAVYAGEPDTLAVLIVALVVFVVVVLGTRARRFAVKEAVWRPVLDIASARSRDWAWPPRSSSPRPADRRLDPGDGASPRLSPVRDPAFDLPDVQRIGAGQQWIRGRGGVRQPVRCPRPGLHRHGCLSRSDRRRARGHGRGHPPSPAGGPRLRRRGRPHGVLRLRPPACLPAQRSSRARGDPVGPLPPGPRVRPGHPGRRGPGRPRCVRRTAGRCAIGWVPDSAPWPSYSLVIWAFGRGQLPPVEATIRAKSFIWPAAEVGVGLAVFGFLVVMGRRHRDRATGNPLLARSEPDRGSGPSDQLDGIPRRPGCAVVVLRHGLPGPHPEGDGPAEGGRLVDRRVREFVLPDAPDTRHPARREHRLRGPRAGHLRSADARSTCSPSWDLSAGKYPSANGPSYAVPVSLFCPAVKTLTEARLFGVGFVLEQGHRKGPPGSVFVKKLGDESLFRIPGAAVATLTPLGAGGSLPPTKSPGTAVPVTYPSASSWKLTTRAGTPQVLRLRLTDVPGWHASIDGKPLKLLRFNGAMFEAKVPAGQHTVELHYWPDTFTLGIVVAVGTAVRPPHRPRVRGSPVPAIPETDDGAARSAGRADPPRPSARGRTRGVGSRPHHVW